LLSSDDPRALDQIVFYFIGYDRVSHAYILSPGDFFLINHVLPKRNPVFDLDVNVWMLNEQIAKALPQCSVTRKRDLIRCEFDVRGVWRISRYECVNVVRVVCFNLALND